MANLCFCCCFKYVACVDSYPMTDYFPYQSAKCQRPGHDDVAPTLGALSSREIEDVVRTLATVPGVSGVREVRPWAMTAGNWTSDGVSTLPART